MTTTQLTTQEKQIIMQRREESQAREEARLKREEERAARIAERKQKEKEEKDALVQALIDADKEGVLSFEDERPFIYVGRHRVEILMEEHRVSSGGSSYYTESRGWKYFFPANFNNYSRRTYKKAETVLKKFAEENEKLEAKTRREQQTATLNERAVEAMKELHPNRTVELNEGYRPSRHDRYGSYRPTTVKVHGEHGSVSFTFGESEGKISFHSYSRSVKKEAQDIIDSLILG